MNVLPTAWTLGVRNHDANTVYDQRRGAASLMAGMGRKQTLGLVAALGGNLTLGCSRTCLSVQPSGRNPKARRAAQAVRPPAWQIFIEVTIWWTNAWSAAVIERRNAI